MSSPKRPKDDKVEVEEKATEAKRPPGWRNFQKVLKQVVKSPPMRKLTRPLDMRP
jgi:hypothetical protein